jgi:RNA polymerase sigma-70 factor (ECF subfamily)
MTEHSHRASAEERFRAVFAHLGAVTAYARRRGAQDPDALAAETMTIAWRRLADVPTDDARPWLFVTARNLLLAERRHMSRHSTIRDRDETAPAPELRELDPQLEQALAELGQFDREALLLVAWEELSPAEAARALGVSAGAFRVRLLRARRRLKTHLEAAERASADRTARLVYADVEGS